MLADLGLELAQEAEVPAVGPTVAVLKRK
jgi:hypothetical protein